MNSDEFNRFLLREEDEPTAMDLIRLYMEGRIAKEVFKSEARRIGGRAMFEAAKRLGGWALAIAVGAALGTAVGYGINKLLYTDYEGEAGERIKKALKDMNYAKAELDLYCKGTGKLCSSEGGPVKCLGKPKTKIINVDGKKIKELPAYGGKAVGGYKYESAEGLGIGAGREQVEEFGSTSISRKLGSLIGISDADKFEQRGIFDTKDLAVIAGIANAIVSKDILAGRIEYDPKTRKMEVGSDAVINDYKDCIKFLLSSNIAQRALGKYDWLKNTYDMAQLALGLKPFKELKAAAKVAPVGKQENVCES